MPFTVNSYAALSKDIGLVPHKLERRDLLDDDVLIDIAYTGICHSDLHFAHNDWKNAVYPVIPGHEIVGTVKAVGKKVSKHQVGDCVAVGCLVDSCGECFPCKHDEEVFCLKGCTQTYNSPEPRFPGHITAGGYSEEIVVAEHFALKVPKALQTPDLLPGVAPILCAGITTYSPLREFQVKPGQKVGIVGLGGLGLMGVRLAKAMGADVYVVSRNHKKDDQAKQFGATAVISSHAKEELDAHQNSFDLILDTVPFDHDVNVYMPLLKNHQTLVIVGHIGDLVANPFNTSHLVFGNRRLAGSCIGGIKETQELLDFCAEHKIVAENEVIEMENVNDAWKRIEDGTFAKRFIIDIKQFREKNSKA